MSDSQIYVLSYGGGVNSSALLFHIWENKHPLDIVLFADTGEETKETYETVQRMIKQCAKKNIEFVTVKSKYGNMYDYYYKNKSVMSVMRRDCTAKFKIAPIRQYLRSRYGKKARFKLYIGIASEEYHRMRTSDVKYIENLYPLIESNIDRDKCKEILIKNNFKAIKSGCVGCPFRPKKEWVDLAKNNPKEFERWEKLEINCSRYPQITIIPNVKLKLLKEGKDQKKLDQYVPCDVSGGCFL